VLSGLVKEVYTMEIIKALGESAQKRLKELEYTNVTAKVGDGYYGWPEQAPFDAIIVTAAATDIPPPLVEQLKAGGRMVIPVGSPDQVQMLKLVTKNEEGPPTVKNISAVRFVPLTGEH
jgi:protein-L-isoaspartate(D-aspartate) O-methyltransferase